MGQEVSKRSACQQDTDKRGQLRMSLEDVARGMKDGTFRNVVVMCGAGISTAAGVPDFRSPSTGLYMQLRNIPGLPYPEAVFDGSFFRQNPAPFYSLVRKIYPRRLKPTLTHRFFKLLHDKGLLLRVYTQNIDALEFLAGLPEDKVVEAHGTFQRSYCTKCKATFDLRWLKAQIFNESSATEDPDQRVPKCPRCGGVVRPDVVLFGEALPDKFWSRVPGDFAICDLLLVFGTSLAVAPFNTLVGRTHKGVVRVYINRTKPGAATSFLGRLAGLAADISFNAPRDLVQLGDCDMTVQKICESNGWLEDLEAIPVETFE